MKRISPLEKKHAVWQLISDKFELGNNNDAHSIFVGNHELPDIPETEIMEIVDRIYAENHVFRIFGWGEEQPAQDGFEGLYCCLMRNPSFHDAFQKLNQSLEKQTDDAKGVVRYTVDMDGSNLVITVDNRISCIVSKMRTGIAKEVMSLLCNNPNVLINQSFIENSINVSEFSYTSNDRLDQIIRNVFKDKHIIELLFETINSKELKFRKHFTSKDIEKLGVSSIKLY